MSEKIYAPTAKAMEKNGKYGPFLALSFNVEKIIAFINANKNSRGYINFNLNKRREADKYGNTHSLVLDDWEPDSGAQNPSTKSEPRRDTAADAGVDDADTSRDDDGVPF
jgi:hypothetical protein